MDLHFARPSLLLCQTDCDDTYGVSNSMSRIRKLIPLARSLPDLNPSVLREHLAAPDTTPLHLPGLLHSWPAIHRWQISNGLDHLRRSIGENRLVEVELVKRGRGYLDPDHQRIQIPFGMLSQIQRSLSLSSAQSRFRRNLSRRIHTRSNPILRRSIRSTNSVPRSNGFERCWGDTR